ncbi:Mbov_0396 family ICE element transmembrane protein [[Mycoplasma] anseris]|uniref:Uncharacterized protein n=1 Tax=[Mycoplasma] anseris TaxID=92400 RepID=A0A2Z4NCZ6_9BACT|nr:hypothetical protein [[Mycoplasma] anseris]AWX69419.1 hypothetical protein DP065_01460 [[Mycoplasma] anseris]
MKGLSVITSGLGMVILGPFVYLFFGLIWGILVSFPFAILDGLFYLIDLVGFKMLHYMIYGSFDSVQLSIHSLPIAFLGIVIICVPLICFAIIGVAIKFHIKKGTEENQKSFKESLRQILPAIGWIVAIPLIIFILNLFMILITNLINKAITLTDDNINLSVVKKIYLQLNSEWPELQKNLIQKGAFLAPGFLEFYKAALNFTDSGPSSIDIAFSLIKNAIVGWVSLSFLGGVLVSSLVKTLQLYFLFIISPFVATSSIVDGGKNLHKWKEMFMQKALAILTQLSAFQFYLIFITGINRYTNEGAINKFFENRSGFNKEWIRMTIQIVLYSGTAIAVKTLSNVVVAFIGEATTNDDFKMMMAPFKKGAQLAMGVGVATAAVASGGATLGATAAKGGMSAIGGTIGKGILGIKKGIHNAKMQQSGMSTEMVKTFNSSGTNKDDLRSRKETFNEAKSLSKGVEGTGNENDTFKTFTNSEDMTKSFANNITNYDKEIKFNERQLADLEAKNAKTLEDVNKISFMKSQINDMKTRRDHYINRSRELLNRLNFDQTYLNQAVADIRRGQK